MESDQKDLYISELKAENFELRHRHGHFHDLRDRVAATEHEISIVNDDRRRIEEEMRIRKREDDETIRNIQGDNDGFKGTISAREAEIEDLKAQIDALRREDKDITESIRNVTGDITGITGDNEGLRRDLNGLEGQFGDEKALGRKLRADLDKAKTTLNVKEDENGSALHTIRCLEDDLNKNRMTEEDLGRILADKSAELDDKNNRLRSLEEEISRLRMCIDDKDREAHDLNHRYGAQLDLTNKERSELDRQLSKNADLDATVRRLEDELCHLEKDISSIRSDVERLRRVFEDADMANKGLEDELNALNRHAQLLESQNVDLTKELDGIVIADERVRADLDRKHRVSVLQQRNDEEIRESIHRLTHTRSISPTRSPIRSSHVEVHQYHHSPCRY